MNDLEKNDFTASFSCPYSAGMDLEKALERARTLYRNGDLEAALLLLGNLEKKYVRAVQLFDLLGDILVERGNTAEGRRYKTIYETLSGTFKIAGEDRKAYDTCETTALESSIPEVSRAVPKVTEGVGAVPGMPKFKRFPPADEEVATPGAGGLFPVTAAMGQEFIRQGHFDRAAAIFSQLSKQHPEDETVRASLERARRMSREKKVLGVLQGWLTNIEKIKSSFQSKR